jgi:hypothetical protein
MHRITRNDGNDSRATFAGGRNGMIYGALAGAIVTALATLLMELFFETSTAGVSVMAGAAAGGLIGMMMGALRARNGGYHGHDRRLRLIPIDGPDRRTR